MNSPARFAVAAGALLGGLAVGAGAFGAHGLRGMLEAAGQAANWETACRYGMYHALALVAVGLLATHWPTPPATLRLAAASFLTGTAIFSGCLATLALTGIRILGAIVPIGGVLLIVGWVLLAVAASTARPGAARRPT